MRDPQVTQISARRSRGRPRQDSIDLIEAELLQGALNEFLKTGYGGTSVRQIVNALGMSKTTLYSRYPSKEALFRAIVTRQVERLAANAMLEDGDWPDVGIALRTYANRTLEISLEGELREVNRLIYSESQRFPELGIAAADRTEVGIQQITTFIQKCADRDRIPIRNARGVAEAFIFMLRGWYVNILLTNQPVSAAHREAWVERAVLALISGRAEW